MTTFTEHYGLRQPEETDGYDIGEMNENMATIDAAMAAQEESMEEMNEKLGTAADTGNETIFGKLNQMATNKAGGFAGIKSLQRVTLSFSTSKGSAEATINEVDPEKCIVLMDRIYDSSSMEASISYSLTATKVSASSGSSLNGSIKLQFQIIELM